MKLELEERKEKILNFLKEKQLACVSEIKNSIGLKNRDSSTVTDMLERLQVEGKVERIKVVKIVKQYFGNHPVKCWHYRIKNG